MYICDDDYSKEYYEFMEANDIQIFHFRVSGNKEPDIEIDQNDVALMLSKVLDERNHPSKLYLIEYCYIVTRERVGCVIGCLRKLEKWSLASIFDEYRRFSGTKLRITDQEFIEIFNAKVEFDPQHAPKWFDYQ